MRANSFKVVTNYGNKLRILVIEPDEQTVLMSNTIGVCVNGVKLWLV